MGFGSIILTNSLLGNKGGQFFLGCNYYYNFFGEYNYDKNQTNILSTFYYQLLSWCAELRR